MNLQDKADLNSLRKEKEENLAKISRLTKEVENLKSENASNIAQIIHLKDQVSQMILKLILTDIKFLKIILRLQQRWALFK